MLDFHAALPIIDLEPLDLQIGALPENQAILAEPSILRWFEYSPLSNRLFLSKGAFHKREECRKLKEVKKIKD
ncbi:hypothetical protein GCM10007932_56110 [Vibrio penaeicida]|uniref:Uncharacterized protein n=1 Tax=Vibrio penaeicida TaxID=104609 RepID=A0AAV5P181_9VIBR|nr:hypothetical protein GCM10007932_56110 [Vibrio penaeicida]